MVAESKARGLPPRRERDAADPRLEARRNGGGQELPDPESRLVRVARLVAGQLADRNVRQADAAPAPRAVGDASAREGSFEAARESLRPAGGGRRRGRLPLVAERLEDRLSRGPGSRQR